MSRQVIKSFGDYELYKRIGHGSYGDVYMGKNMRTHETIAIKQLKGVGVESKYIKQEIRNLSSINHENIMKIHCIKKSKTHIYLITEFCEGGTLQNKAPVSEHQLQIWSRQLINGLLHIKERGIIHRDLKPANILLSDNTDEAKIKIADFGLSKDLSANSLGRTRVGTPYFMAPEISKRENYSYKADIWSLGVVLYYMLVGRHPHNILTREQLDQDYFSVEFQAESYSEDVRDFICKMLVVNVNLRSSVDELQNHPFLQGDRSTYESSTLSSQQKIMREFCNQIESDLDQFESFLGNLNEFDSVTALGIVAYAKINANQLIDWIEEKVDQHGIVESDDLHFPRLYKRAQQVPFNCDRKFDEMREICGSYLDGWCVKNAEVSREMYESALLINDSDRKAFILKAAIGIDETNEQAVIKVTEMKQKEQAEQHSILLE